MVSFNDVQAQLVGIDCKVKSFTVDDIRHLAKVLRPSEKIMASLRGWYHGSMSVLCATDMRIIILNQGSVATEARTLDYKSINRLRQADRGLSTVLSISITGQRHDFRTWRFHKCNDVHNFVHRHMAQLRELAAKEAHIMEKTKLPLQSASHPTYMRRSWRSFVKSVGNTSMGARY